MHTTIRDQFPLEIFVFGESIPVLKSFCCLCSGGTLQIYLLLLDQAKSNRHAKIIKFLRGC
nr:MAG TPA: hypothetical protein [Caudoviricetes sp.]